MPHSASPIRGRLLVDNGLGGRFVTHLPAVDLAVSNASPGIHSLLSFYSSPPASFSYSSSPCLPSPAPPALSPSTLSIHRSDECEPQRQLIRVIGSCRHTDLTCLSWTAREQMVVVRCDCSVSLCAYFVKNACYKHTHTQPINPH